MAKKNQTVFLGASFLNSDNAEVIHVEFYVSLVAGFNNLTLSEKEAKVIFPDPKTESFYHALGNLIPGKYILNVELRTETNETVKKEYILEAISNVLIVNKETKKIDTDSSLLKWHTNVSDSVQKKNAIPFALSRDYRCSGYWQAYGIIAFLPMGAQYSGQFFQYK
jgi:hypothetical protein